MSFRLSRSTLHGALVAAVVASPLACGSGAGADLFGGGAPPRVDGGREEAGGAGGSGADDAGEGGTGGEGATGGADAGFEASADAALEAGDAAGGCDLTGTWATVVSIPTTWPATFVLLQGQGSVNVLLVGGLSQSGTAISGYLQPCRIALPDFQSNLIGAFEKYGIRFPDPLFDNGGIAPTPVTATLGGFQVGDTFKTDPVSLLIGLTMQNPVTDAWPDSAHTASTDDDADQHPGVTAQPALGPGYYWPPVDATKFSRADALYVVTRTVTVITGTLKSCDEISAKTDLLVINNKPAIDSHVIGCHVANGGECNPGQANFVDTNQPFFNPSGGATALLHRVANGATCADARVIFP